MNVTIYRHTGADGLFCAVPQGRARPAFVRDKAWVFVGLSTAERPRPDGFDEDAARSASQTQGFYPFRSRSRMETRLHLGR